MQKIIKKLSLITFIFIMVLSSFGTKVYAASTKSGNILSSSTAFHWSKDSSYAWEDFHISEFNVDGEVGYCLEPSVDYATTNSATGKKLNDVKQVKIMPDGSYKADLSPETIQKITLIANYGYQYPGHNTSKFRWATQTLIWETIGWVFDDYGSLGKCEWERNEIMALVNSHSEKTSWNGTKINASIGEVVTLTDTNNVVHKFNVVKSTTKNVDIVEKAGDVIKLKVTGKPASLVLKKPSGLKDGVSFVYSDGKSQKICSFGMDDPANSYVDFNVTSEGTLKIAKVDTDGNFIPNVVFKTWYTNESNKTWNYKTGNDGTITIPHWNADKEISIQEIEVPNHLVLDPAIKKVTLKVNETSTVTFTNNIKKANLSIVKQDTKGNKIPGVTFIISKDKINTLKEVTTDDKGIALIDNLDKGIYFIKETKVPDHLVLNPQWKEVTLEPGKTTTVKFTNDIKSSLRIYKVDKDTDKPIPNTKFNILNENKELVKSVTTDDKGIAKADYLTEGKYFIEEVEVPKPYVINPNNKIQEITIKNNQDNFYEVVFKNEIKKVDFVLYKQNSKNKQLLNGAIYEFSTVNKEGVKTSLGRFITGGLIIPSDVDITLYKDEALTDKAGTYKPVNNEVIIEDLKPGNYYTEINNKTIKYTVIKGGISLNALPEGSKLFYKEIKAPIGYILDTKEYEVNLLGEHNELISNYRTNDAITILPKTGENNNTVIASSIIVMLGVLVVVISLKKKES